MPDRLDAFERLRGQIAADLTPVRPMARPAVQALWLSGACVAFGGLVVVAVGLRADVAVLGPWASFGLSAVQLVAAAALVRLGLAWSIPAMGGSAGAAWLWVAGALVVHVAVGAATQERSWLAPATGREWRTGLACLAAITALALPTLALGIALVSRGTLTRVLPAFLVTAVACGLVGDATWRLHCPYSAWSHVLPFHTGALVPVATVALALAARARRRA